MKRNRPARIAARAALIAGVLALFALFLLHTGPVRQTLFRIAATFLQSRYGLHLEANRFDYNVLTGSLGLESWRLRSPDHEALRFEAAGSLLRLRLRWWPLLYRSIQISEAEAYGLKLKIVRERALENPTPGAASQLAAEAIRDEPLDLFVSHLHVPDASMQYEDRPLQLQVELPRWQLEIDGDEQSVTHRLTWSMDSGSLVLQRDRTLGLSRASLAAVSRLGTIDISALNVESQAGQIQMSGQIGKWNDPDLRLRADFSAELQPILKFTGTALDMAGSFRGNGELAGTPKTLRFGGRLDSEGLRVSGVPDIKAAAEIDWVSTDSALTIRSLTAQSARGTLRGSGRIDLEGRSGVASSLEARMTDVDLLALSDDLKLPVRVASRARAEIQAHWPGLQWKLAAGHASARLEPSRSQTSRGTLPLASLFEARFGGNLSTLELRTLRTFGVELEGTLSLGASNDIEGRLEARSQNLRATAEQLQKYLGSPSDAADSRLLPDGTVTALMSLGGTLRQPVVFMDVAGTGIRVGSIQDLAVHSKAILELSRIRIQEGRIESLGQRLDLSGDMDLRGSRPVLNIAASIAAAELKPLLSRVFPDTPVSGSLNAHAVLKGPLNQLQGRLSSRIAGLRVSDELLGDLETDAELDSRKIKLRRLQLLQTADSPPAGGIEATGDYELDSGKYAFQLSGQHVRLRHLDLFSGQPLQAHFNLSGGGSGTLSQPMAELRVEAQEVRLGTREIGSMTLQAKIAQQELAAEAILQSLGLSARMQAALHPPYTGSVNIVARDSDLSRLHLQTGEGTILNGILSAEVVARGNMNDWKSGQMTARIHDMKLSAGQVKVRNEGPVEWQLDRNELTVLPSRILVAENPLRVEGRFPFTPEARAGILTISGEGTLESLQPLFPSPEGTQVAGKLGLELQASGNMEQPQFTGRLSLHAGRIIAPSLKAPFENLEAEMRLAEGIVRLERISGRWAEAIIGGRGDLPLGLLDWKPPLAMSWGAGPATFSLEAKDLSLATLAELPPEVSGQLSLRFSGQASRLELGALQGRAELDQLRLQLGEIVIGQTAPAILSLEKGVARLLPTGLSGSGTSLELRATAGLAQPFPIDLNTGGYFDTALLRFWIPEAKAAGQTRFHIAVGGTLDAPDLSGYIETHQAQFAMPSLGLIADGVDLRLGLKDGRIELENISGTLNGGALQGEGSARLSSGQLQDIRLDLNGENLLLEMPRGFKSRITAELRARSQEETVVLGGMARILEGSFRERLDLEGNVLSLLQTSPVSDTLQERNPLLSRLRYDFGLSTDGPVAIDNNLAKLSLTADLRLGGSFYRPLLTGRITAEEGGEVLFNERRYLLERGVIDFLNQAEIEPTLDISARAQVSGDEVSVEISGTPKNLSIRLSSQSGLAEPDIVSLLLTGRTLDKLRGSELDVAKEQLLSQLTGRIGDSLTRNAGAALGLSQLRIEPNLIAPESDPAARFTVGKDITGNVKLVYSMNLLNGGDQIWLAEFDHRRMFSSRAVKQADNTYRVEFRHDLAWGGKSKSGKAPAPALMAAAPKKVGRVDFFGEGPLPKEKLADVFRIRTGDEFDFFKLQAGLQRIGDHYAREGHLEARVRVDRSASNGTLDLSLQVAPGAKIDFLFDGWNPPDDLRKQLQESWREGIMDSQRTDSAVLKIREYLVRQGYLEAQVTVRSSAAAGSTRQVAFQVEPGTRYSQVPLIIEGAQAFSAESLRELVESAGLSAAVHTEPTRVADLLTRYYRKQGFLDVVISDPRLELVRAAASGAVYLRVREGMPARAGELQFTGNVVLDRASLQSTAGLASGTILDSSQLDAAVERIERAYWQKGFNDVEVRYRLDRRQGSEETRVSFEILENRQVVLTGIRIEGSGRVGEGYVREKLGLAAGDILSYEKLNLARKNLHDTGVYASIDLFTAEVRDLGALQDPNQKPVLLTVRVRETNPIQVHYGAFYDNERGAGGIADIAINRFLGGTRLLGTQARYDSQLHEIRGYFSQPSLAGRSLKSNATLFLRREIDETFISDRLGFSVQQEGRWRQNLLLSYGYRYERVHTFARIPDPIDTFDVTLPIARLTGAVSRDRRDDLLDATRGSFFSQSIEYAPRALGSDIRFVKYYGQYFKYLPLSTAAEVPFAGGLHRSRWIFAVGARVGLAQGFDGQQIIPSERFYAGGGTTLRGFDQDSVGPQDFLGYPAGGEALFLLNNEIRFPIHGIVDGVGFLDIGNVYATLSDFDPFNVRKSAGLGLRFRTPYFLLRFDYGFKLDRKPGESLGRFFFSIGQAY